MGDWSRASYVSVYDKHSFVTMSINFLDTNDSLGMLNITDFSVERSHNDC